MSNSKKEGELSQTCKSFLHEWYANDNEPIYSKYIDKGNFCEGEAIDMMAKVLGFGVAEKNREQKEDDFFIGECDVVLSSCIVDTKCVWDNKSLHDKAIKRLDEDYELQLLGYCHLWNKPKGILFYALLDTPGEVNYEQEVSFSYIPENERWIAYEILANEEKIKAIQKRVIECRKYLIIFDLLIKSKLGKVN